MRKTILLLIILIITHILHILEEILGHAWFIDDSYGGLNNFMIIMMLLLIPPLLELYMLIKKKKIAYYFGFAYIFIMMLDGAIHIIEFILKGKYFYGSAGLITGVWFMIFGILLWHYMGEEINQNFINKAIKLSEK